MHGIGIIFILDFLVFLSKTIRKGDIASKKPCKAPGVVEGRNHKHLCVCARSAVSLSLLTLLLHRQEKLELRW